MKKLVDDLRSRKESKIEGILVIGIDFGTTFSGAAWATIEDFAAEQINMILSWPGNGREEGKVPTAVYYDENDEVKWGYDISDEVTPLQWFKLLLLRSEDLPEDVQQSNALLTAKRMLRQSGKPAVDVVADYLRALWEHIISTIYKERTQRTIDEMKIHVVLTVPAIWQGYARQAMREAAKKADIMDNRSAGPTTLSFAPEPEAAAIATMCQPGRSIRKHHVYIICDAGGGTVDLVNYQISKAEPLELRELGVGTGKWCSFPPGSSYGTQQFIRIDRIIPGHLCGGIFIDEAFREMCEGRLGRQWNKLSGKGIKEIMTKEWELGIRPQFKPQDTERKYIVPIPAEAVGESGSNDTSESIKNGRIHFSSSDIKQAFEKVFQDIKRLIDGQIQTAKEAQILGIILIGGLGSSAYLYDYLSSKYESQSIEIIQSSGTKPRTAICRGAVYKGFIDGMNSDNDQGLTKISPVHMVSTVARQSTGIVIRVDFTDGVHEEEDKIWDENEGRYYAEKQMN